ncbi:unnamed protein product [Didymodactylos carnosus]|uniref:Pentapeptide repeat-containing protein n=2 Tax=Didymodactylos carnosus TaxID=1234261 RepID=A0A814BCH3_9BILA|nr:unnamed protein product [Didymodactylos carnosus]CAF3703658.1 unnamed protein product [Didymodactylos carnosus]
MIAKNQKQQERCPPTPIPVKAGHTRFEWLKLVATLAIPVAIGVFTIMNNFQQMNLSKSQFENQLRIANDNRQNDIRVAEEARVNDLRIAQKDREKDLQMADNQQKQAVLIEYQNFLAELLLKEGIRLNGSNSEAARFVARFKTLTGFSQLNPERKAFLFKSLYEVKLITNNDEFESAIVSLASADLTNIILGLPRDSDVLPGFKGPCFTNLHLSGADLTNASFRGVRFSNITFANAVLDNADFGYTEDAGKFIDFQGSSLQSANFFNANYKVAYYIQFQGAKFNNARLMNFICVRCGFTSTIMQEANMTNARFTSCQFILTKMLNCIMVDIFIKNSTFDETDLTGCDMRGAIFEYTTFSEKTQLIGADMSLIELRHCDFSNTNLSGCNMTRAILNGTSFLNSNLSGCVGLNEWQLRQTKSLAGSTLPNGTLVRAK